SPSTTTCPPSETSSTSSETTSSTGMTRTSPSRITCALGAVSTVRRSRVRFARISSTIPTAPFATRTKPNRASWKGPTTRVGAGGAWRELYRETAPAVDRYLRARGVRDADDVVGDTFVNVVRSIDGFAGDETAFRAWVFAIARNRATDELRRVIRHPSAPM